MSNVAAYSCSSQTTVVVDAKRDGVDEDELLSRSNADLLQQVCFNVSHCSCVF